MKILIVVDNPKDWPLDLDGVEVVGARAYLTEPAWTELRRVRLFNLCRSYAYQSVGYYVSLLAEARGHRPSPSLATIQDTRSRHMVRMASEDLEDLIERSLGSLQSDAFMLSIYFGRNLAKRHATLSARLFELVEAPLLQARFVRREHWELVSLKPISADAIPPEHHAFVVKVAQEYFAGRRPPTRRKSKARYDLAILVDPEERDPPSNGRALARFERAAEKVGFAAEQITREDFSRISEFDALFIRATTSVNHYTYRFAQRAQAEGLVVMDDPGSILRCTNKVFLAELLQRLRIRQPKTVIVHRRNLEEVLSQLRLPCVLKAPDSAFSRGVHKVETREALIGMVRDLLERSELIVAQEYLPTQYDWRVGIIDGEPLYVCRYWMADAHWQIVRHDASGSKDEGNADTLAVADAPPEVVRMALKAANAIGQGLYGVDIKESDGRYYVMEVNDNPSIDAGVEDSVLKDELYLQIMRTFLSRVERVKRGDG